MGSFLWSDIGKLSEYPLTVTLFFCHDYEYIQENAFLCLIVFFLVEH